MPSRIIFYITLLNWEFLLNWYNFFWNFCWIRDFLLCTTISIDFNSKISFLYVKESESGVGNFGNSESDILPPTPQPRWPHIRGSTACEPFPHTDRLKSSVRPKTAEHHFQKSSVWHEQESNPVCQLAANETHTVPRCSTDVAVK